MENFDGFYGMTLYLSRKDAVKIFIFSWSIWLRRLWWCKN